MMSIISYVEEKIVVKTNLKVIIVLHAAIA